MIVVLLRMGFTFGTVESVLPHLLPPSYGGCYYLWLAYASSMADVIKVDFSRSVDGLQFSCNPESASSPENVPFSADSTMRPFMA